MSKKNAKNDTKNLEDPKKSVIFAAEFNKTNYTAVLEKTSSIPCKAWKPKEALGIREMLIRSERGQRLDVHTRFRAENMPDNMYVMEFEDVRMPDGSIVKRMKPDLNEDTFDHTPPEGINDITDLMRYSEEIAQRKKDLIERRKKTVANAPKSAPAEKPKDKKPESSSADAPKEE